MALECDFCGSHQVKHTMVEGVTVYECELCGEIFGNPDAVQTVLAAREARERHIDGDVFDYVKRVETIPGFEVLYSCAGDDFKCVPPFVKIKIDPDEGMPFLEKFVFSVEHSNLYAKERWIIEITMHKGMQFELKPAFSHLGKMISPDMVNRAIDDISLLLITLARDMKLSWWYTRPEGGE